MRVMEGNIHQYQQDWTLLFQSVKINASTQKTAEVETKAGRFSLAHSDVTQHVTSAPGLQCGSICSFPLPSVNTAETSMLTVTSVTEGQGYRSATAALNEGFGLPTLF